MEGIEVHRALKNGRKRLRCYKNELKSELKVCFIQNEILPLSNILVLTCRREVNRARGGWGFFLNLVLLVNKLCL